MRTADADECIRPVIIACFLHPRGKHQIHLVKPAPFLLLRRQRDRDHQSALPHPVPPGKAGKERRKDALPAAPPAILDLYDAVPDRTCIVAAGIAAREVVGERGIEEPRIPDLTEARLAPLHVRIDHASAARAAGGVECLQDISDKTHGRVLSRDSGVGISHQGIILPFLPSGAERKGCIFVRSLRYRRLLPMLLPS